MLTLLLTQQSPVKRSTLMSASVSGPGLINQEMFLNYYMHKKMTNYLTLPV